MFPLGQNLFGRTFLMLTLLIAVSFTLWIQIFLLLENEPRALRLAQQVAALVNLTSTSLDHIVEDNRVELLNDLKTKEGIVIYPKKETDTTTPLPDNPLYRAVTQSLKQRLGDDVIIAGAVNGNTGIWISFKVDNNVYWLTVPRDRFASISEQEWLGWGMTAVILSLLGAGLISSVVAKPIQQLTEATAKMRRGNKPDPIPESGPKEIKLLNHTFNAMVQDIEAANDQRALILAGISHDLRTPLSRLRLEIELSKSDEQTRNGMVADIEEMDRIVGQFLEFARPHPEQQWTAVELGSWIKNITNSYSFSDTTNARSMQLTLDISEPDRLVLLPIADLGRAIINLLENARRYGISPNEEISRVELSCIHHQGMKNGLSVMIRDHGPGIPDHCIDLMKKPFTRLDNSRGSVGGSGLGLSIVERLIQRYNGQLTLSNHDDGGFVASLWMPYPVDFKPT